MPSPIAVEGCGRAGPGSPPSPLPDPASAARGWSRVPANDTSATLNFGGSELTNCSAADFAASSRFGCHVGGLIDSETSMVTTIVARSRGTYTSPLGLANASVKVISRQDRQPDGEVAQPGPVARDDEVEHRLARPAMCVAASPDQQQVKPDEHRHQQQQPQPGRLQERQHGYQDGSRCHLSLRERQSELRPPHGAADSSRNMLSVSRPATTVAAESFLQNERMPKYHGHLPPTKSRRARPARRRRGRSRRNARSPRGRPSRSRPRSRCSCRPCLQLRQRRGIERLAAVAAWRSRSSARGRPAPAAACRRDRRSRSRVPYAIV